MSWIKNEREKEIYAALWEKYPQGGEMTAEDWNGFAPILDENIVYQTKKEMEGFSQCIQ